MHLREPRSRQGGASPTLVLLPPLLGLAGKQGSIFLYEGGGADGEWKEKSGQFQRQLGVQPGGGGSDPMSFELP